MPGEDDDLREALESDDRRSFVDDVRRAGEEIGRSRALLEDQQKQLASAFISREEFHQFEGRARRRDRAKFGLIAALLVLVLVVTTRTTVLVDIVRSVTSPAARAQQDAQVGALICALAADHHALHGASAPKELTLVVPVFEDGKPTGKTSAVQVPCPRPVPPAGEP